MSGLASGTLCVCVLERDTERVYVCVCLYVTLVLEDKRPKSMEYCLSRYVVCDFWTPKALNVLKMLAENHFMLVRIKIEHQEVC